MKLNPNIHLHFNGHCEAAFRFYERCLDATISFILTYRDSPMAATAPPGWDGKIVHATLNVGGTVIQGADVPQDDGASPRGFELMLQMDDTAAAERVFAALAENGSISMPLQETFWAGRFGVLVDQFGIPWSVNCERGAVAAGAPGPATALEGAG
jgi:PhnB protein